MEDLDMEDSENPAEPLNETDGPDTPPPDAPDPGDETLLSYYAGGCRASSSRTGVWATGTRAVS
jgi:hypothetical protein